MHIYKDVGGKSGGKKEVEQLEPMHKEKREKRNWHV